MVSARVRQPRVRALRRERLHVMLAHLWEYRLGLLVAPAGSGKTTLMADFAAEAGVRVAWYRAETWDGEVAPMLEHIRLAFGGSDAQWTTVEGAARSLEESHRGKTLLIIDDLHALESTAAEQALERFVQYAPESLAILAASRTAPAFNLSRLRVSGDLLEVSGDDLRFRSWEAERLFRDVYGVTLPPEELAELTRRTEGWAAGLQLFHLAVRGKAPGERRRLLSGFGSRSRLQREYLTRNVLDDLPSHLRAFLLRTCVLTRLSGRICDDFLRSAGSAHLLDELERRQIFTHEVDENVFRYHEVLRRHLEVILLEELGEAGVRDQHRHAGAALEAADALSDALGAYARAEDWDAVHRLLKAKGRQLSEADQAWVTIVPATLVQQDPWLLLALARHQRTQGNWAEAVQTYQVAEKAFGGADPQSICVKERLAIAAWLNVRPQPSEDTGWSTLVRRAVSSEPSQILDQAARLAEPDRSLVAGLAALAAGKVASARANLLRAADAWSASAPAQIGARIAGAAAGLLGAEPAAVEELEAAIDDAERLNWVWLARIGRAALALAPRPDGVAEASAARLAFESVGDGWSAALAVLCQSFGDLVAGEPNAARALEAARRMSTLGAPVLEAWAFGLHALALTRERDASALEAGLAAERAGRSRGCLGARLLAHAALAESGSHAAPHHRELLAALLEQTGIKVPGAPVAAPGPARIRIKCFGSFALSLQGREVDLSQLKPRARSLLRLLAMQAGAPVHREELQEALWPGADAAAGAHNLQVAVSALRQVLEPGVARGSHSLLVRDGEAYRLALSGEASLDVSEFKLALSAARSASADGEGHEAVRAYRSALALYAGDLLTEDGPAEWVLARREQLRSQAVAGYRELAELLLKLGDAAAADEASTAGLRIDRYQDRLWKLSIEALGLAGEHGAARRREAQYASMLAELGVPGSEPPKS